MSQLGQDYTYEQGDLIEDGIPPGEYRVRKRSSRREYKTLRVKMEDGEKVFLIGGTNGIWPSKELGFSELRRKWKHWPSDTGGEFGGFP